jgi:hypothetical protein
MLEVLHSTAPAYDRPWLMTASQAAQPDVGTDKVAAKMQHLYQLQMIAAGPAVKPKSPQWRLHGCHNCSVVQPHIWRWW